MTLLPSFNPQVGVANSKIRDAEILVRNPSPRLFGKKFWDSKKVKTNHAKTRLRDLSKTLPSFRDPAKICRDPRFARYHSPPLQVTSKVVTTKNMELNISNRLWTGSDLKQSKKVASRARVWPIIFHPTPLGTLFTSYFQKIWLLKLFVYFRF